MGYKTVRMSLNMNVEFQNIIKQVTEADALNEPEIIQSLWSGYGRILRIGLVDSKYKSVVVKHVRLPSQTNHPRGWDGDNSHNRKVRSYEVETAWYEQWASQCDAQCRIPECLAVKHHGDEVLMVLEDLDASGYPLRKESVSQEDVSSCLSWLAHFHARYLGESPKGLWDVGTYWHLDTRPDELQVLSDIALKKSARAIDTLLKKSTYQTFVHGDAKLANFCFSDSDQGVSAVDFQYVGGGCGMKDVAYFIGSCLGDVECERQEQQLLDIYFSALQSALVRYDSDCDGDALENEWRNLYYVAWADFHRFLKGWSPGHWKINSYSERITQEVIRSLPQEV